MTKSILITGATDGIGLQTARRLAGQGHVLLLHGRNPDKLDNVAADIAAISGAGPVHKFNADFGEMADVRQMARDIRENHARLDVVLNNAGIFNTSRNRTRAGLDVRFAVNTLAPYLLTCDLLSILDEGSRVINLSSAAQAPVDLAALRGDVQLSDFDAYAQSKLALTMWTSYLARQKQPGAPLYVSVNPGSYLATKMVQEGFGRTGNDVSKGVNILERAALTDMFEGRSGAYFDNDIGQFSEMHPAGRHAHDQAALMSAMDGLIA